MAVPPAMDCTICISLSTKRLSKPNTESASPALIPVSLPVMLACAPEWGLGLGAGFGLRARVGMRARSGMRVRVRVRVRVRLRLAPHGRGGARLGLIDAPNPNTNPNTNQARLGLIDAPEAVLHRLRELG